MRKALALVFGLLLSASALAETVPKLLVIDSQPTEPYRSVTATMLKYLAEQGYVPGSTLQVTSLSLGQHEGQAESIWRHYKVQHYSVVYTSGTIASMAFAAIMRREPNGKQVYAAVTDPVGAGLVAAIGSPPTGNVTGVQILVPVKERLRFIRRMLPAARTFGCVYGDFPQSASYRAWLERLVANDPEFKDVHLIFRKIQFVPGDGGTKRMVMLAKPVFQELSPEVDAFLSPVDPLGLVPEFGAMVVQTSNKPLIGMIEPDAHWGAAMTIYPSLESIGRQAGKMVARLLAGEPIVNIPPEPTGEIGVAFDPAIMARYGLTPPSH